MELAEVKKYFENAKEVQDHAGDKGFVELEKFEVTFDGSIIQNTFKKNWLVLWHNKKGFAKILTTKEPSFSITKNQLRQLTDPKVKEWFPEVFEVKLEVGKWYKRIWKDGDVDLFLISDFKDDKFVVGEFFRNDDRLEEGIGYRYENENENDERYSDFKATEQEVFEALKNEAVKRGFVEGSLCKWYGRGIIKVNKLRLQGNKLWCNYDNIIMDEKGKWATIIPTKTRKQAEKELNCKIID